MNRSERNMKSDWEQSWERKGREQGRGFTPVQIFLLIIALLLFLALAGMGLFYFGFI